MSRPVRSQSVDAVYEGVGKRIYRARTRLGISQQALADLIGFSRTSVTNLEKGKQRLMLHTFLEIAAALRIPPLDLLPSALVSDGQIEGIVDKAVGDSETKAWILKTLTSPNKK